MNRPEVSLLILAHDTPREVEALLNSIVRHTRECYEILLIDNGSSFAGRAAHARLAAAYDARLIELDANLTFSIANNIGLGVCSGEEVVFLNSDVVVTHDWLSNLRAALHSGTGVGLVGPRTTFSQAHQGGIWLDDDTPAGVDRFGRFFNHHDRARWFDVDWLAGFALLARRRALDAVGGFDETVPWHGLEDRLLGQAVRAAGWRVIVAGDTFVHHAGHRTFEAAGVNRTATRVGRPAVPASVSPDHGGRLVRDEQGLVFELRDGVAHHLEILPGLIRAGRPIEEISTGELAAVAAGPPISNCRVRGTDEVWVLHGAVRRRVRGDPQRIRRLPWVWQAEPGVLDRLPEGPPVQVEEVFGPVPEIPPRLPSNPVRIAPERLATVETIAAEIGAALDAGRGYSLIRLEADEVLVLNQGMWPAPPVDRIRAGIRDDLPGAALALRHAIVGADAVGVPVDDSLAAGPELLKRLLFHYDLYPRRLCSADIAPSLMGLDGPGEGGPGAAPLPELLAGRRVALVCSRALASWSRERRECVRYEHGLDVRLAFGLDHMHELDFALGALAGRRSAIDVVLVAAAVPAKPLCTRLARELDLVALDLGGALDQVVRSGHRAPDWLVAGRGG